MKTFLNSYSGIAMFTKSFGFQRPIFLSLCLLLIFQAKPASAQPWQQLGPGAGGQERALYLHENIAGNYVLYVGSDVSGVWRSRTINPNQRNDPNQYYYDYISNHRIFRFVNKFYRPSTYDSPYLFALNRSGIDRINLYDDSEEMKKIMLNYQGINFDKSWVSDIYIGPPLSNGEHQVYFTTGNTRVSDGAVNNHKESQINDLYFGKLNSGQDQIDITTGLNFINTTFRDVYCLYVDEGTNQGLPTDDLIYIGSDEGLHISDYSGIITNVSNPDGTSNIYKVTSIQPFDQTTLLVTIHGQGVFAIEPGVSIPWTSLMTSQKVLHNQNLEHVYPAPNGVINTLDFTQLFPVKNNGNTTGYLVTNEFPRNTGSQFQNAFIGLFYCSAIAMTGMPDGDWMALDISSNASQNEWGWNTTPPCANINGAVLTRENELYIGKQGNIFKAKNPVSALNSYEWKQIYTTETPGVSPQCTLGSYRIRGYVNAVATSVFPQNANKVWETYRDRLIWYDETTSQSYKQVKSTSQGSGCFYFESLSLISNSLCTSSSLSDALFVKEYGGLLYSGISEGFSSNQGNGYLLVNDPASVNPELWTQHRAAVCGDPMNYFNIGGNEYLYVNPASGNNYEIRFWDQGSSSWNQINNTPWNGFHVRDVKMFNVPNPGINYFVILANAGSGTQKVYIYESDLFSVQNQVCNYTNTSVDFKFENIEIISFNAGNSFKVLIGCSPTATTTASTPLFYELNQNCTLSPVASNSPIFEGLPLDNIDNTDHGITAIHVNSDLNKVYAATISNNQNPGIPVKSKLYRSDFDPASGIIDDNWNEITGNVPNKSIRHLSSKSGTTSCNDHSVYGTVRGLGVWKFDETPLVITTSSNVVCAQIETTTAAVNNPFGGTATYLWSTGATTAQISNLGAGTYTVTVESGSCSATGFIVIMEDPSCCNTLPGYITQDDFDIPNTTINTDVNLNENVICDHVFYITGAKLSIKEGVTITITSSGKLRISNSELFACGNMWAGIVVEDGGELIVENSVIKDAQYGTRVKQNGHLTLRGSTYDHNYVGVHISDLNTGTVIIDGSTFSCDDCVGNNPLKSGYPGQWPEPNVVTYAGIEAFNSIFNVGVSGGSTNHFNGIYRGVSVEKCFNTLIQNSFSDIVGGSYYQGPGGYGIYSEMSGGGILRQAGFGEFISSPVSFDNVPVGIFSNGGAVTVTSNHMTNVGIGVFINRIKGTNANVISNLIHASEQGVLMLGNEKAANVNINYNNIITDGNFSFGVSIFETNLPDPSRKFNVNCNSITLNDGVFGIYLSIASNISLLQNNITLNSASTYQTGVALDGSTKCFLLENTVTGNSATLHTAFRGQLAENNNFTLNHSHLTKWGFDFGSNCASDELFKGNTMGEHDIGLHINTDGIIGKQDNKGNKWLGPFSSSGAENENADPFQFQINPIIVHEPFVTGGTLFHPTNSVTAGVQWFDYDQFGSPWTGSYPNPCSSYLVGGDDNNEKSLTYTDTLVVNDSIVAVQFEDELKYFTSRSLLEKLSENDSLKYDNGLFENYFVSKTGTSQIQLTDVCISLQSEISTVLIQNKIVAISSGLDSLMLLDSLFLSDNINLPYRENYLFSLLIETNSLVNEFGLYKEAEDSVINVVSGLNIAVNPLNDIELYEKQVNEFHYTYRDSSMHQMNPSNLSNLAYIASLCPYAYGKAVFRARAELSRYGIISFYDDKYNCALLGYSRQMQQQDAKGINRNNLFVLFPNPASDQLYLFSDKAITSQSFIIHDCSGRVAFKSNTVFKNGIAELDISTLVPGVYSISTKNGLYSSNRSKFTVIR